MKPFEVLQPLREVELWWFSAVAVFAGAGISLSFSPQQDLVG